jgi:hypothetical protein
LCVFNPTESSDTLRKNAVIAQASAAQELTTKTVQEVKLQNTEGDCDAKIDKMAFFRRVSELSVGLKTHKVGLPSWKKHLGTSSGP